MNSGSHYYGTLVIDYIYDDPDDPEVQLERVMCGINEVPYEALDVDFFIERITIEIKAVAEHNRKMEEYDRWVEGCNQPDPAAYGGVG